MPYFANTACDCNTNDLVAFFGQKVSVYIKDPERFWIQIFTSLELSTNSGFHENKAAT